MMYCIYIVQFFIYIVLYFASYRVLQRFGLLFFRVFCGILVYHVLQHFGLLFFFGVLLHFGLLFFLVFCCILAFNFIVYINCFFRNKRNPVTHCVFLNDRKIIFV